MPLPELDPIQVRVLGCLVEKQMSTPEYYPLTLNALVNACNQSSNRDPVLRLEEGPVLEALDALRREELSWTVNTGGRAIKYEHRLAERFRLAEQEVAILCELMLRGPQTPGELRARTARLYAFPDLAEVEAALASLADCEEPLVVRLPRAPGAREARVAHRLAPVDPASEAPAPSAPSVGGLPELRAEVDSLRAEVAELQAAFEAFRAQFD